MLQSASPLGITPYVLIQYLYMDIIPKTILRNFFSYHNFPPPPIIGADGEKALCNSIINCMPVDDLLPCDRYLCENAQGELPRVASEALQKIFGCLVRRSVSLR